MQNGEEREGEGGGGGGGGRGEGEEEGGVGRGGGEGAQVRKRRAKCVGNDFLIKGSEANGSSQLEDLVGICAGTPGAAEEEVLLCSKTCL